MKTFDQIKRYIKRHDRFYLAEASFKDAPIHTHNQEDFKRMSLDSLSTRLDIVRMFNWAKDRELNG